LREGSGWLGPKLAPRPQLVSRAACRVPAPIGLLGEIALDTAGKNANLPIPREVGLVGRANRWAHLAGDAGVGTPEADVGGSQTAASAPTR
jgi:hypothetical protein